MYYRVHEPHSNDIDGSSIECRGVNTLGMFTCALSSAGAPERPADALRGRVGAMLEFLESSTMSLDPEVLGWLPSGPESADSIPRPQVLGPSHQQ